MKMWEEVGDSDQSTTRKTGLPMMRTCGQHGVYISFLGESGIYTGCADCAGNSVSSKCFMDADENGLDGLTFTADIPEDLLEASFATFRPTLKSHPLMLSYIQSVTKQWMTRSLDDCGQLVFLGAKNAGKSHIALSALRSLSIEHSVFYIDTSRGEQEIPKHCYVLVLDNLFSQGFAPSESARKFWNQVIYERAALQLPTILASDRGLAEFRQFLSSRTLHWMRVNKTQVVNFEVIKTGGA